MIMFVALCSRRLEVRDTFGVESEHVCQDLVRMLAQKRRSFDLHFVVRKFHRLPDRHVFSTLRMVNFHEGAGGIERVIIEKFCSSGEERRSPSPTRCWSTALC